MIHPVPSRAMRSRLAGFTLIEVMVSLAIGLVILIAIGTVFLSSSNLTRQRENQADIDQPARIVLRQLQHDLSMAGYVDIFDLNGARPSNPLVIAAQSQATRLFDSSSPALTNLYQRVNTGAALPTPLTQLFPGLQAVFGCDGAMNSTPNAIVTGAANPVLSCGTASATQQTLQVAYQVTRTVPALPALPSPVVSLTGINTTTGEGLDCLQQNPPNATTGDPSQLKFVVNRFWVSPSPSDAINELYCAGSGNATAQPMVRGVEEFVLRYQLGAPSPVPPLGVVGPAAGSVQAQYVSAANVVSISNPSGWANVTAVEVCIVSATAAIGGAAAQGARELQPSRPTCTRDATTGAFATNIARAANDNRFWKRFTSVISVRNAVFASPN